MDLDRLRNIARVGFRAARERSDEMTERGGTRTCERTGLIVLLAFTGIVVFSASCSSRSDGTDPGDDTAPVKLIYDGDIGPDPCDFSTLSMLHEYHNRGMIELIGVVGETPDLYLASTFSIYDQLYGNGTPIGSFNDRSDDVPFSLRVKTTYAIATMFATYENQNKKIYERYGNEETRTADDVPGPVEIYRQLLAEAEDDSITIYAAGQLYNFPALFASQADHYSSLNGEDLVCAKVSRFVFMGGYFPSSFENPFYLLMDRAEWNWWALGEKGITRATMDTLAKMGKPITYVGYKVGLKVPVGRKIVRRLGRDHPTSEAYFQFRLTYGGEGEDLASDNPAFDDVALYYVVEGGEGRFFDRNHGHAVINDDGANTWEPEGTSEGYLTLLPGVEDELIDVITDRVTGFF